MKHTKKKPCKNSQPQPQQQQPQPNSSPSTTELLSHSVPYRDSRLYTPGSSEATLAVGYTHNRSLTPFPGIANGTVSSSGMGAFGGDLSTSTLNVPEHHFRASGSSSSSSHGGDYDEKQETEERSSGHGSKELDAYSQFSDISLVKSTMIVEEIFKKRDGGSTGGGEGGGAGRYDNYSLDHMETRRRSRTYSTIEPIASADFGRRDSDAAATARELESLAYTPSEEKRLLKKYDLHVLTFLCAVYLLSIMDRTNIGNAYQAGMATQLGLENKGREGAYPLVLNFFYIGYIMFQWCIMLWKVWRPSLFAPVVIICWGVVSCAQAAVKTWVQLLGTRFLLGAFEAAFSPGIYFYFSFFYHRQEMAKRVGVFQSFSPLSSSFSGAIAYAITQHPPAPAAARKMDPWRLLFLIEGMPTIVCGFIAFYAIYDSPHTCRFLSPRERDIARARTLQQAGSVDRGGHTLSPADTLATLADPKVWFHTVLYFSMSVASVPIPIFLPTILKGIGYTNITAQGMSAPPYLVAVVAIIAVCYLSDRFQQRAWAIIACCVAAIAGYVILALGQGAGVRYFGLFLAVPGVYASHAIIMTWTGDNQGSDSKRGVAFIVLHVFGLTGPILGTRLFPKTQEPRYLQGIWVTVGFVALTLVVTGVYRVYLARLNRRLDERQGNVASLLKARGAAENRCMDENSPLYRYFL